MFLFEHLGLVKALQFSITRKDGNQYYLVTSRPYGLLYQREISHLNVTTPPSTNPLPVSPNGRPYIWLDCDIERSACKSFNILNSLLEAQPRPVIKLTGGKQLMSLGGPRPERSWEDGGEKKIQEVELLLSEDELAHWCRYCHRLQIHGSRQVEFQRISGKGYSSEYGCVECLYGADGFRKIWPRPSTEPLYTAVFQALLSPLKWIGDARFWSFPQCSA